MFFKSAEDYYKEMTSTLKDVDISEKSLVYNSLMPCCYELSYQSMMLDEATKMVFADSALKSGYSDCVERRCLELGVKRKLATTATGIIKVIGKKKAKLPQKTLVATSLGITYTTQAEVILDDSGIGFVEITASGEGSKYNADVGEINSMPVRYEGIFSITNENKIDNGYDKESVQALYDRYLLKVQTPATSGNKYNYKNWCLEVTGVGSAEVYPLWAGKGTVKCVITNSNKRKASQELIDKVKNYIDPGNGTGEGQAPIGATLSVTTVEEKNINVTVDVQIDTSITLDDVKNNFSDLVTKYFDNIVFKSKKVSIAKLGGILIGINGVIDHSNLKINNSTDNITLNNEEIAVLGTVMLGVI